MNAAQAAVRRPHVIIVGAGFGGLAAAQALGHSQVDVTLIDRRNHHLFQPLLYQVATAGLAPAQIASPIRSIVRDQANTRVILAEVTGIDVAAKTVTTGGRKTAFDYLILATGATHAYFGHDAWAAHAPGLKTLDDAVDLRRRVLTAFEAAETACGEAERRRLLTFAIVGAGPTGVELSGAIAELARRALTRDFRAIRTAMARRSSLPSQPMRRARCTNWGWRCAPAAQSPMSPPTASASDRKSSPPPTSSGRRAWAPPPLGAG